MLSAPHAFGIDGRAASGGRVNFNSGCPLDYEFGIRETVYCWSNPHFSIFSIYTFRSNEAMMNYASMCC